MPNEHPKPVQHPKPDDFGSPVIIREPSTPTDRTTWFDPNAIATFVPGGEVPAGLNDVPFESWEGFANAEDWEAFAHESDFDEPLFEPEQRACGMVPPIAGAGVIIRESDGRFWVVHPSNGFAGYKATFPKGTCDELSLRATAIKEAWEESGLRVRLRGFLADSKRSWSYSRYYLGERLGGSPAEADWETQAVSLVPLKDLEHLLNMESDKRLLKSVIGHFVKG